MICRKCHAYSPEGARFCASCGSPLTTDPGQDAEDIQKPVPEETPDFVEPEDMEPVEAEQPKNGETFVTEDGLKVSYVRTPEEEAAEGIPEELPYYCRPVDDSQIPPETPQTEKKSRTWVPVVIIVGMIFVGLLGFLFLNGGARGFRQSRECPWLSVSREGMIRFRPRDYDGDGKLEIPETLDGIPVRAVAPEGFAGSDVVTVSLPESVRVIGKDAFRNCQNLRGMFLPEGIQRIEENAFRDCRGLEAICIPGTVNYIGDDAFDNCMSLRFVFYSGYYMGWEKLYGDYINPFTCIFCVDGSYRQGNIRP